MSRINRFFFILALLGLPLVATAQPVTQPFTFSVLEHELPMVRFGSVSWGDLDGDSDLDVFLSGESEAGLVTGIYINEGVGAGGVFRFVPSASSLTTSVHSFSSWADFDGDGDLDLLVAGSTGLSHPYTPSTHLYRNDAGSFTDTGISLPGLHSGSSSWGDLDKDGDLDLVMTGVLESDDVVTVVAMNTGAGQFEISTDDLPGFGYGDSDLGDVDKDGDLDLVLTGAGTTGFHTTLFLNNSGTFTANATEFGTFAFSSVDLGDYDNDGDLDLVVSGGHITENLMDGKVALWSNTGGTFSAVSHTIKGVLAGDASWGDYDNDGDLDLMLLGAVDALGKRESRMYRNDGGNSFVNTTNLVGSIFSDMEWGDFDADGDLDLIASGFTPYAQSTTHIYVNERQVRPTIPGAPKALSTQYSDGTVELRWSPAAQSDPSNTALSYNVRVGSAPGTSDVVASMSDRETGRLQAPRPGNASFASSMQLDHLPDGTYFWSVQAVNHALVASEFASEGSFTISGSLATDAEVDSQLPRVFSVRGSYPNPFSSTAHIEFDVPEPVQVSMRIYSLLGKEVAVVTGGILAAGTHQLDWDGRDAQGRLVGSGLYLFELRAGTRSKTGSLTLIR
jgi:hypothetical protein